MYSLDDYTFVETATKVTKVGNNYIFSSNDLDPMEGLRKKLTIDFHETGELPIIRFMDPRYFAGIVVKDQNELKSIFDVLRANKDVVRDLFSRNTVIMIKAEHMSNVLDILKYFPESQVLFTYEDNSYAIKTSVDNYSKLNDSFELYTFEDVAHMHFREVTIGGY